MLRRHSCLLTQRDGQELCTQLELRVCICNLPVQQGSHVSSCTKDLALDCLACAIVSTHKKLAHCIKARKAAGCRPWQPLQALALTKYQGACWSVAT